MDTPRPAGREDAAAVAAMLDAFNREYGEPTPGVAVLTARIARLVCDGDAVALLAGQDGVALMTLRPNVWEEGPVGLLDELYVRPGMRGRGIGAALLASAEDALRARGGTRLEVPVDAEDVDARRFYERRGYTDGEGGSRQLTYLRLLAADRDA